MMEMPHLIVITMRTIDTRKVRRLDDDVRNSLKYERISPEHMQRVLFTVRISLNLSESVVTMEETDNGFKR